MMRVAATVLVCLVTGWTADLSAQATTRPAPAPSLRDLLGEEAIVHLAPSFGWLRAGDRRAAVDAQLLWQRDWDRRYATQLGLNLGSAHWGLNSYRYSGIAARVLDKRNAITHWLQGMVNAGGGVGPAAVFQISGGSKLGRLELELRSTWLGRTPGNPYDSLLIRTEASPLAGIDQHYTDAEASARRAFGKLTAGVTTGSRFGGDDGTTQWAFASATLPLRSRFGLSVAAGTRPAQPERAIQGGRFLQLSIVFDVRSEADSTNRTPAALPAASPRLQAERVNTGSYRLRIHAAGAQSVELKGDLTDWEPLRFTRKNNQWETLVHAPAGSYRINVRIDGGAWTVPAGLVVVTDGFGGWNGILTLN